MNFPNNPKPYWPNNSMYFLTGSTFLHYPYFKEDIQKQILLNQIKKINNKLKIPVSAYSISMNHYHIKLYLKNGLDLARIKKIMHGGTSFLYQKEYKTKYRQLWQSSHTLVITTEEMNWKINGYIAGNLLKHGEVNTFNELLENKFSSYWYMKKKYSDQFSKELVRSVINVNEDGSGRIDKNELLRLKSLKPSAKAG